MTNDTMETKAKDKSESQLAATTTRRELAASYARKSDPNEEGVQDQHVTNAERAAADGFEIPTELRWGDDNVSGTATGRRGLDKLLELITSGTAPFTRLYIRGRNRLSRASDPRFAFYLEYLIEDHGVKVCYSEDTVHVEYDKGGDAAQFGFITSALKHMQSSGEWVEIRRRTTRGTRKSLKKGRFVAAVAPYGYDRWLVKNDTNAFERLVPDRERLRLPGHHFKLRVNAAEQVALRQVFDGIRARKPYAQIARELELSGAPRDWSGGWTAKHVREIARNPIHKGAYVHGRLKHAGTPIPVEDMKTEEAPGVPVVLKDFVAEAPLTESEWERLQAVVDERQTLHRQRKRASPLYLLTSVLVCSACGDSLFGHRQASRSGVRVRMYRHTPPRTNRQRQSPPCPFANRYVRAEPLEAAALEATRRMLSSDDALKHAREELTRLRQNAGAEHHAAALRDAEAALSRALRAASEANLRAARATGDVERQIHDATMRELLLESEALTVRVESLRSHAERIAAAEKRLPSMETRLGELQAAFDSRSTEEQKGVVAAVVESMRVDFDANAVEVRVRAV